MSRDNRKRPRDSRREKSEFEQRVIDIARVTRVVAGGRRFRFRATVVIGNKNGKVGVGLAKGGDVSNAIQKAVEKAKKSMTQVALLDGTIPYETQRSLSGATIFLKPAKKGTGIIAGGPVRAVLEVAGVQNILSKMLGSHNKTNNAHATFYALTELHTPKELAALRGKELEKKEKKQESGKEDKAEKSEGKKDDNAKTDDKKEKASKPDDAKKAEKKEVKEEADKETPKEK
ncbi:30S ribosomal protein S5 [Patescibacteria group bacterium]